MTTKELIKGHEELNTWLRSHDFRLALPEESSNVKDYHYDDYERLLPNGSKYGLEIYILDDLRLKLRLLRDTKQLLYVIIGQDFTYSGPLNQQEFKEEITKLVQNIKKELQEKINNLKF